VHWWTLFRMKPQLQWWTLFRIKPQLHWWTLFTVKPQLHRRTRFCESNFSALLAYTKRWFTRESNGDAQLQAYWNTARSSHTSVRLRLPFLMTYNEQKSSVNFHFFICDILKAATVNIFLFHMWRRVSCLKFTGVSEEHALSIFGVGWVQCFSETSVNFYHTRQRTIMCLPEAWNRNSAGPTFACTYRWQQEESVETQI